MGKYPPIPVRLNLTDGNVYEGTLFQKNEVINSEMCYNIWVNLDNVGMDAIMMRDPKVVSIEILESDRTHQDHFDTLPHV